MWKERVYVMTKLALFEREHKSQLDGVRRRFRSDYIGRQLIKNSLRVTEGYLLIIVGWCLYHVETLLIDITSIDIIQVAKNFLIGYGIVMAVFLFLSYVIWSVRYSRAMQDREIYSEMLDELERLYELEEGEMYE